MNAPLIREAALDVINAGEMVRRMVASEFAVWRVVNDLAQPQDVTGETLEQIEDKLSAEPYHGATFLIRETNVLSGKAMLHTIRIRRGKAIGWDRNAKRTYAYSADRLCSVAVTAFAPVEPWRWTPGCDVIGLGNVIEGKRA